MEWIANHQWFAGSMMLIASVVGLYCKPRLRAVWVNAEVDCLAAKANVLGFESQFRDAVAGANLIPGDATCIYGRMRAAAVARLN